MAQLTDLPDELLLQILAYTFPLDQRGHVLPSLASHIISRRLYDLSHQAFFETYIHRTTIVKDMKEWDEGTLLCDIYSPTFSKSRCFENCLDVVINVQRLELDILVEFNREDETLWERVVGECLREMRRYPRLRSVYMSAVGEYQGPLRDRLREAVLRDTYLSGVRLVEQC